MVEDNEASPLTLAAEQYGTVKKYAGAFLQTFTFHSARRHDPLLVAIALLKRLYAEKRRTLPDRVPVSHLSQADRLLILGQEKPNRRLYEIATLAAGSSTHLRIFNPDLCPDQSGCKRPEKFATEPFVDMSNKREAAQLSIARSPEYLQRF